LQVHGLGRLLLLELGHDSIDSRGGHWHCAMTGRVEVQGLHMVCNLAVVAIATISFARGVARKLATDSGGVGSLSLQVSSVGS